MKTARYHKTQKPKGKWLTDDDLRSDQAIQIGCPDVKTGQRININFTTAKLREFMAGNNKTGCAGGMVIDDDLIVYLVRAYGRYGLTSGNPPDAIEHPDYPFKWFVPFAITTYRTMAETLDPGDEVQIPAPVRALVFLAVPRKIHTWSSHDRKM